MDATDKTLNDIKVGLAEAAEKAATSQRLKKEQLAIEEKRRLELQHLRNQERNAAREEEARARIEDSLIPGAVLYSITRLRVSTETGVHGIPPGSKLMIISRVDDESFKLQYKEFEVVARRTELTMDEDYARELRMNDDKRNN